MRRFGLALVLTVSLCTVAPGCGGSSRDVTHRPTQGSGSVDEATSPAGGSALPPGLRGALMTRAREFRGNPWPLGALTGAVLVVALGLGAATILIAYRGR